MDTRIKKEIGEFVLLVFAALCVYLGNRIFGFEATVMCMFTLVLWKWMKDDG